MNIGTSILTSRIGRRFFLLFFISALLPMVIFVWISYQRVSTQLYEQSSQRLRNDTKIYCMALMDRLVHMSNLLQLYSSYFRADWDPENLPESLSLQLGQNFDAIATYQKEPGITSRMNTLKISYDADKLMTFMNGNTSTTLLLSPTGDDNKQVSLIVPFGTIDTRSGVIIAEPKEDILWGVGALSVLPPMTELAVYDSRGEALMATSSSPGKKLQALDVKTTDSNYLQFEYKVGDETFLASGWSLFLQSYFNSQTWTVTLSESTSNALKAMLEFRRIFPLLVTLTLWIILFLSFFFLRRTLAPLAELKKGTEKVAEKDFTNVVSIKSGDEFEQLADSFNDMTSQLHKQFNALEARSEIDRAILSSLDQSIIIPRALRMIHNFIDCHTIALVRIVQLHRAKVTVYSLSESSQNDLEIKNVTIGEAEQKLLFEDVPYKYIKRSTELPTLVKPASNANSLLILPMGLENKIDGAMVFSFSNTHSAGEIDEVMRTQARQLANQLEVALSNSQLFSDLEKLSIGTVEALARTVDAKSKWTAGHSERVADLSRHIARTMGLSNEDQSKLHRAGLLHDIGKIGIPVKVLDKPGRLTDEEYDTIKTHPAIGGKILEPIEVYQDIIPIVEQHHERYDGKGYPLGLSGDKIDPLARILCAADVYDALISQRPYRDGWIKENVLSFMAENKGIIFDPEVTDVLLALKA